MSKNSSALGQNSVGLNVFTQTKVTSHIRSASNRTYIKYYFQKSKPSSSAIPTPLPVVFSIKMLPFFCKIEHKMAKGAQMPLKFRLGTVEYVDLLEGKIKQY